MKKRRSPSASERSTVQERLRARLAQLAQPCVGLEIDDDDESEAGPGSNASCVGKGAYVPAGARWPVDDNGPMNFVAQVNFADAPPLDGFPRRGLLQWFVSADDTYGLTFDESAGAVGFVIRWFNDTGAPSVGDPAGDDVDPDWQPVQAVGKLIMTPGLSLPAWDELSEEVRAEPLWREVAEVLGDPQLDIGGDGVEPEDAYEDVGRGYDSVLPGVVVGSKIGGFASFTQADPRGEGQYPAADTAAGRLILQLDSAETAGWGDAGIAQLFGDPESLAAGVLGPIRYHWDCG